ncbi:hypothetical protein MMC09_004449 [Bachmanniomyces sp. S44760]|nr:hypothetical protein [Bachmanniomyces sp. S44760]
MDGQPWPQQPIHGRPKWQFVWPRDKHQSGPPWKSWTRWKDVFSGKGPGIWINERGGWDVNRPMWSEWREYDNLGYRDVREEELPPFGNSRIKGAYDFKSRKYRRWHPGIWSDAKWPRKGAINGDMPHYMRDGFGNEWSDENGWADKAGNPWRYHYNTPWWDWTHPEPWWYDEPANW